MRDQINQEIDKRKFMKLLDSGQLEEFSQIPVLSVSECCNEHMLGEVGNHQLRCSRCKKPCTGAEE